jgi:hypothetical protein
MTPVQDLLPENPENISALVKNLPHARANSGVFVKSMKLLARQSGTGTSVYAYRPHRIDHLHKAL